MIKLLNLNESEKQKTVVGSVGNTGNVESIETRKTHTEMGIHRGRKWRYNPANRIVYWQDEFDDCDKDLVVKHLLAKYNYKVDRQIAVNSQDNFLHNYNQSHGMVSEDDTQPDAPTFKMYHGGKRWSFIPSELQGHAQGRYEGGVGIYFTNSYNTARKYAKGSRVVHLVEIDRNFKSLDDLELPLSNVIPFLKNVRGLKHRAEIIDRLKFNAERGNKETVSADILNNLVINYEAGAGTPGIEISKYFVSNGADAKISQQSGDEFWLIVFNPNIIKKVTVVNPAKVNSDFEFMLPNIKKI